MRSPCAERRNIAVLSTRLDVPAIGRTWQPNCCTDLFNLSRRFFSAWFRCARPLLLSSFLDNIKWEILFYRYGQYNINFFSRWASIDKSSQLQWKCPENKYIVPIKWLNLVNASRSSNETCLQFIGIENPSPDEWKYLFH